MNLTEFQAGGLNITGFRLLDKNSDAYQDFIWEWRSYVKNSSYQEVDINYFHLVKLTFLKPFCLFVYRFVSGCWVYFNINLGMVVYA